MFLQETFPKKKGVSQPPFSRGAIFGVMGRASISSVSHPNTLALEVFWSSNTDPPKLVRTEGS